MEFAGNLGQRQSPLTIDVVNAENLAGQRLAASFTHKDAERVAALASNQQELTKILSE